MRYVATKTIHSLHANVTRLQPLFGSERGGENHREVPKVLSDAVEFFESRI